MRPVTENARYGATRNPWNPELSAGGSSGGSASAVASRMVALADASDLGGSIRIPASCCGLVGLKPSLGRVSIGPDFGDLGGGMPVDCVLTRTVLDTAVALDAIAGYEPGDRHHAPAPPASFADAARSDPGRLRVRLCLSAPFGMPVDAEPAAAARAGRRRPGGARPRRRRGDTALGRRGVPVELGDVHDRHGTASCARHRAPPRAAGRRGPARAGDTRVAARGAADAAGRPPRGRRAPVGVRAADPGRVGARRDPAHADAHPAPRPGGRDQVAGRRHRRREPVQRARADLERHRPARDQPPAVADRRTACRSASSSSARTAATTCS